MGNLAGSFIVNYHPTAADRFNELREHLPTAKERKAAESDRFHLIARIKKIAREELDTAERNGIELPEACQERIETMGQVSGIYYINYLYKTVHITDWEITKTCTRVDP